MGVHIPSTWEQMSEADREASGKELDAPTKRDVVDDGDDR